MSDETRTHDVTVIAIGVDDDLVLEGVGLAVAERIDALVRDLTKAAVEVRTGGLLRRAEWEALVDRAAGLAGLTKTLGYVRVFYDQWPESAEETEDGDE